MKTFTLLVLFIITGITTSPAQERARDLGIRFEGQPGQYNAITDVKGVLVGYKTLIKGDGPLVTGKGPVRTGVTVIMPNGRSIDPLPAGFFTLNGDGEMTGTTVIEEYGLNYGPIGITNTNSVGVVRDAIGEWNVKNFSKGATVDFSFGLPVAAETFDGILNDINGFHVKKEDVFDALNSAHGGKIEEGNVGGGTGMSLFLFKGGSGTSSRVIKIDTAVYTVGAFVQGNFGGRKDLIISGVPVGRKWKGDMPLINSKPKDGSIIIIIGTDAPLLPAQLKMVAKRASLGVARCGGLGRNGSGDIFLAFSTVPPRDNAKNTLQTWTVLPKEQMDKVYEATVQSVEEAIINAMIAAKDMKGINGNTVYAIPHDKLMQLINSYSHKAQ
ncbi:MAG TPA: P1 family peptidase [Mucilaginibacter sp.]